jgi:hypothetical protein
MRLSQDGVAQDHSLNAFCSRAKFAICSRAAIAALLGAMWEPALAGTEVRGQHDDLQLRAENASTREVLDALAGPFKLTYQLPADLERSLSGRYSGTLRQVLARILDGNDYIVSVTGNGMKVIVLGASRIATTGQAIATAPGAPSAPASGSAVQRPAALTVAVGPPILPASSLPPPLASYLPTN